MSKQVSTFPRRQESGAVAAKSLASTMKPTCDGSCVGPFIEGLREHFGKDAELPTSTQTGWTKDGFALTTIITPPVVVTRSGRKKIRTYLSLPFCGICGKANR